MKKNYVSALDGLRVVSIIAVLLIHTSTRTLELDHLNITAHLPALFLNQISRFAVPLFFLISGFSLELSAPVKFNLLTYIGKRLKKIFIPYIFWSLIYFFFIYTRHSGSFLHSLTDGSASYQLYFIPSLLIFYLIFPVLHYLYRFLTRPWIFFVLAVVEFYLLHNEYSFKSLSLFYPLGIVVLNYLVFIFGMFISHHQPAFMALVSRFKYLLLAIFLILAFFVYREGLTHYLATWNYLAFYGQWRISILFYTLTVFSLLYYIFSASWINRQLVQKLSEVSFFVFFIHVLIIELFTGPLGHFIFIFFPVVTLVSFFLGLVSRKIPGLKFFTG